MERKGAQDLVDQLFGVLSAARNSATFPQVEQKIKTVLVVVLTGKSDGPEAAEALRFVEEHSLQREGIFAPLTREIMVRALSNALRP